MEFKYIILCFCFSIVAGNHDAAKKSHLPCTPEQYLDTKSNKCIECTKCGKNKIIRKPCEPRSNALCGPFFEFDKFHQAPIINLLPTNINGTSEDFTDPDKVHVGHLGDGASVSPHGPAPIEANKDEKWYTLAMALLGVLCFVALFVMLYILLVCFVCKKRRVEKQVIYDPEFTTPLATPLTPRYVEMQMPSRDRLKKSSAAAAQYSEESDDSGATANLIINPYAPVSAEEYDADNSGATVSSASTNYVYFKAPSNRSDVENV